MVAIATPASRIAAVCRFLRAAVAVALVALVFPAAGNISDSPFARQVQQMYVAYYGRPGDTGGVVFWEGRVAENGGNWAGDLINAFGTSAEYTERFGTLSQLDLIDNLFTQLFNRSADPEGRAFYADLLSGSNSSGLNPTLRFSTLAQIALDIANGAQSTDSTILSNKIDVAGYFTNELQRTGKSYQSEDIPTLSALFLQIDESPESIFAAMQCVDVFMAEIEVTDSCADGVPVDPQSFFSDNIAEQVVATTCINCHVEGGVAVLSGARLMFTHGELPERDEANFAALSAFVSEVGDGGARVLSKIRGISHGGGTVFAAGTSQYQAVEEFLGILVDSSSEEPIPAQAEFWDAVGLASPEASLRRASLILAGRLPSDEEILQAQVGDEGLREAVIGLMDGQGFHEFLLRGANDRLHTDAFLNGLFADITDIFGTAGAFYPEGAALAFLAKPFTEMEESERWLTVARYSAGVARAPLELIAHVVENDRPYTEILTANYTMVNRYTARVYRSDVEFADDDSFGVFKVGVNRGQVVMDELYEGDFINESGSQVLAHSGYVAYPHAGILNEPAWLNRYPSTETNRNRARARWTYYHFLGVDIEQSAPRTTDPEALADSNNPTLNNPACTICHERLDPLAGAYQNYGNDGFWRDGYGGLDSLPETYKYPMYFDEDAEASPYVEGDTWYRDMRDPGFEDAGQPPVDTSLRWLGQQIIDDPRFATATVAFWWPALMGAEVLAAPELASDPGYEQRVRAYDMQQETIQDLGQRFADGGFQLKALLADMVLTPWYRANAVSSTDAAQRDIELASLGTDRLLTPEELERKTRAILGYGWGGGPDDYQIDGYWSRLEDQFGIYYGGIDSVGIQDRSRAVTALMANVAERQAIELACGTVAVEFLEAPENRRLFTTIDRHTTPLSEAATSADVVLGDLSSAALYSLPASLSGGTKRLRIGFSNDAYNEQTGEDRNLFIDSVDVFRNGALVETIQAENFDDRANFAITGGVDEEGNPWQVGDVHWDSVDDVWQEVGWILWSAGGVEFDVLLPSAGSYEFRVRAWGTESGDGVRPNMTLTLSGTELSQETQGSVAVRDQIRQLHATLLGDDLESSNPEIQAAYDLLVETWLDRRQQIDNGWAWSWPQEDCLMPRELTEQEWGTVGEDPAQMLYSWSSVLHYFLTHFDYLHE